MLLKRSVFLFVAFLFVAPSFAQKLKKSETEIVQNLKSYINYLADDKLEGRRTGSPGEKLAAEFIENQFRQIGLAPMGENQTYFQRFEIHEGRKILAGTHLTLNGRDIDTTQFFPLTFSSDGQIKGSVSPAIHENGEPWFLDIHEMMEEAAGNPHADIAQQIKKQASLFQTRGATAVILYNSNGSDPDLFFDGKSKEERMTIPVIYIRQKTSHEFLKPKDNFISVSATLQTGEAERSGTNVIGYQDNGAPYTIVIGAHFDHLGYGEDHNSLWTGKPEIHNGADDNASGTALVIEMARLLKESKYKSNNYLFICFSGEELGLFGSKYFTEHPTIPLSSVNFMINCDMVGRLNDSTKAITIGGYGTSPYWSNLPQKTKFFTVKFDSSGIGPSDHTSFYLKEIPVLFFFTGTHSDYHKPTDDADKINYVGEMRVIEYINDLLKDVNKAGKLTFTKTKEPSMGDSPRFTVSLGVMPDYTYSGTGLKIDGVISGKIAEKAGMKAGDIITLIGENKITDINDYMKALSHFKKGDKTTITYLEGKDSKTVNIEF